MNQGQGGDGQCHTASIGITDFAQSELSDDIYVKLPDVGDTTWDHY